MRPDDLQDAHPVGFARQRDVEIVGLQLEQARQEFGVVDVRAMSGIAIAARTGVDADAPAVRGREARKREVVQIDEAVEELARRIDLHRQPSFGEVDLDDMGAFLETAADLGLVLAQEIVEKGVARVALDAVGRIHQAQRGGRYDGLLHRDVGVTSRIVQEAVRVAAITERSGGEPGHATRVTGCERNPEAVG